MLVNRDGIHKMLVRIANRGDPDQTASIKLSNTLDWYKPIYHMTSRLGMCNLAAVTSWERRP